MRVTADAAYATVAVYETATARGATVIVRAPDDSCNNAARRRGGPVRPGGQPGIALKTTRVSGRSRV